MASHLVTHSVEQRCVIKFVVRDKVKAAETLHRLNAEYGEGGLSRASVYMTATVKTLEIFYQLSKNDCSMEIGYLM
jgi:hypothetical protein